MKKNTSLYIYLLLLLITVEAGTGFCQNTPCITTITGNNDKEYTMLRDSGSAVSQNFIPACNGNLSSFSFNYRVLENQGNNNKIEYPVNNAGNPYFVVDLTIYELAAGQSIDETPTSSLSQVFKQSNIQVPIVKPNPRADFAYFTIPTAATALYATKQYCFVIQLNADFCNSLINQFRPTWNSDYSQTIGSSYRDMIFLQQKDICVIEIATRIPRDYGTTTGQIKDIEILQESAGSGYDNERQYHYDKLIYNGFRMKWQQDSRSIVFGISVIPFLPDIVGSNIVCGTGPNGRIRLTNSQAGGTWSVDNPNSNIISLETPIDNPNTSILVRRTSDQSKGLATVRYTMPNGNTTSKLIRVVNEDKPTITPSTSNTNSPCQNPGFTLTGVAVNNQALLLDGKSWAEIPNHPALGITNKFTLEAWVSCIDPTAPQQIICKGRYDQEMGHYALALYENNLQFGFQTQPGYIVKHPIAFKSGEWHHVAGSYDGDTMRLYIDGLQVTKLAVQATMLPNNGKLYIGQIGNPNWWFTYRMNGQIDEARIWNVCRTPGDIKENMNKTVSANNTGLVGYYKFNEPTSADPRLVIDYSGSQNNGYLFSTDHPHSVEKSTNCTAKKIPASIKFGDFSYQWGDGITGGSTTSSITPTRSYGGYMYSVIDSATGCPATSETMVVNMNTSEIKNITIPTNTTMPYDYQENGNTVLTFLASDFINNVATKKSQSQNSNSPYCTKTTTVTITKADCPSGKRIEDYGKAATDLSNVVICNELPYQLEIKGYVDNTTGSIANNPSWDAAPSDAIYSLSPSRGATRVEFQNLKITKAGNATLTYRYRYNNKIDCILTSNITVIPVSIAITSPIQLQTGAAFTAVPTGGTWSSTNTAIATVDNSNGTLTRKTAGDVDIQYKVTRIDNKVCYEPIVKVIAIKLQ